MKIVLQDAEDLVQRKGYYVMRYILFNIPAFVLASTVKLNEPRQHYIIRAIYVIISIFAMTVIGVFNNYIGYGRSTFIEYYSDIKIIPAIFLGYMMAFGAVLYPQIHRHCETIISKCFVLVLLIPILGVLLWSNTRGAYLLFVFLLILQSKKYLFLGGFFVMMVWLTNPIIFQVILRQSFERGSSGRDSIYTDAIQEWLSNPIVGGRIELYGGWAHNFILDSLQSTGVLGFFCILLLSINSLLLAYRLWKRHQVVSLLIFTGLFMYSFSGNLYASPLLYISLGLGANRYLWRAH
ncbi:MAG: hypothetical protein P8N00_06735 [Flavobacteriales bacterium]|nr:hypothetical protein [Flavobacteriales bacterium]